MATFTNDLTLDVKPFLEALKRATAAAGGDVKKLEAELQGIEADIKIQADSSAAQSAIAAVAAEARGIADAQVTVDVDTDGAVNNLRSLEGKAKQAAGGVEAAFAGVGENLAASIAGGLAGGGIAALAQSGIAAITGAFGSAVDSGREFIASQKDLAAATGATGEELAGLQQAAKDAFIGGVGESIGEATKIIQQSRNLLGDVFNPEQLAQFSTQAAALGNLYDKDVNEVILKSSSFVKQFGLDSQRASELVALGLRDAGTAQDDFLDSIAEYSQLAKDAGFSAEEFVGLLTRGGEEGVFNTDKIADSLKEAQIRLQAGDITKAITDLGGKVPAALGKSISEIVKLGEQGQLSVKEVLEQSAQVIETSFAAGEIGPQLRSQLQIAIAGTPAEDLGAELYGKFFGAPIDTDQIIANAQSAGQAASQAAGQYLTFDTFIKEFQLAFAEVSAVILQIVSDVFPRIKAAFETVVTALRPTFELIATIFGGAIMVAIDFIIGAVAGLGQGLLILQPIIPFLIAGFAAWAVATNAAAIASGIATIATAAFNAVLAANPIGLAVVAVAALTAGLGLLIDALEDTAAEQMEVAEAQKESLETQIESNEANQKAVEGTQQLAKRFEELAKKTNRSKEETDELRKIQNQLEKQYPDLIDQTKSFEQNLEGVSQVGKRAATELDGLKESAVGLEKSLDETNKRIIALRRDIALEDLQESFGDFNLFGLGDETTFRGELRDRVNAFEKALKSASGEEQIRAASQALNSFLNKQGERLDDAKQLNEIYGLIAKSEQAAIAAIQAQTKAAKERNDVPPPKPPPKPPPPPDDKKTKTQLELALARYKEIEASQKSLLDQDLKRLQLRKDLSAEEKSAAEQLAKITVSRKLQQEAREVFKTTTDQFGLFVSTSLRLVGTETEAEIRDIFTKLAVNAPQIPLVVDPTSSDRAFAILQELRPAIPITLEPPKPGRFEKNFESLAQRLAEGVAGVFKTTTDTQAAELDKQEDNLKAQLKRNEISYQEYSAKLIEIDEKRTQKTAGFGALLSAALGAVGASAAELAAASFDKVGKSADAAYKIATEGASLSQDEFNKLKQQTLTVGDTFAELGLAAGATFAGMVADGASATDALAQTLKQTLKAAVSAFIPTIFANFLAFIPPPFNVIAATAAVGILNGLIDRYLAFEQGGLVPGGEQLIRVNEAGNEFVMNAKSTKKYLPVLEAMNSGRDISMVGSDMLATLDTRLERVENAIRGLGSEINRRTRIEGELVFAGGANTLVGTFDTISTYNKRRRLK